MCAVGVRSQNRHPHRNIVAILVRSAPSLILTAQYSSAIDAPVAQECNQRLVSAALIHSDPIRVSGPDVVESTFFRVDPASRIASPRVYRSLDLAIFQISVLTVILDEHSHLSALLHLRSFRISVQGRVAL